MRTSFSIKHSYTQMPLFHKSLVSQEPPGPSYQPAHGRCRKTTQLLTKGAQVKIADVAMGPLTSIKDPGVSYIMNTIILLRTDYPQCFNPNFHSITCNNGLLLSIPMEGNGTTLISWCLDTGATNRVMSDYN